MEVLQLVSDTIGYKYEININVKHRLLAEDEFLKLQQTLKLLNWMQPWLSFTRNATLQTLLLSFLLSSVNSEDNTNKSHISLNCFRNVAF